MPMLYTFTLCSLLRAKLFTYLGLKQILDESPQEDITHHGCPRGAGAKRKYDVTQSINTGSHQWGLALFALARCYHLMVEIPSIHMNTNIIISILMTNVNDTTDNVEVDSVQVICKDYIYFYLSRYFVETWPKTRTPIQNTVPFYILRNDDMSNQ